MENYKRMFPPSGDRYGDWEWERRSRSRELPLRGRWSYTRSLRGRLPRRDLSLPILPRPRFDTDRDDARDSMDFESQSQDAESYQNVMDHNKDKKPQNPIQDNMENYRKLLSLGVQLAEDDRHSHMTQGHSSRSKRSAYPSTSRGVKIVPEAKRLSHRRGICEDESSHGVIMEKFIKDVSHSSRSGRARESNDRLQRFPRMPNDNWRDGSLNRRESVIQERGFAGNAFRGGFRFNSNLVSRRRVLERNRCYHFDANGQGSVHDHKAVARKRPFECGGEMRKAVSMGSLNSAGSSSFSESQSADFGAMPYVCDECGRSFGVISEFVEHQIMHTRENLYEYGESFIHSVTVNDVQSRHPGGKRFECKECGETFNRSAALAEHRKIHAREYLAECRDQDNEETFIPSPTFSELQKMYGKDKFYECRVCKETFLHSSALIEHQKIHGRGNFGDDKDNGWERERERERGETCMPSPSFSEFQKMYGKEKIYECKVCGETFLHNSSLREHQKIHTRGNPFEKKNKMCEETFIPSQSFKRRQKTHNKEKIFDFKDERDAFMHGSDLSEHQKIHSRKNFFEGRGFEKPIIHSVSFPESQKSHTITRPPENDEGEKAFTISANPEENRKFLTTENVYEGKSYRRAVSHSLGSMEVQKSHTTVGLSKPKIIAESTIQSSDIINHQKVRSGGNIREGMEYKGSIIHSFAAPRPLKRHSRNEQAECDEEGESSTYIPELNNKRRKIPSRENPYEGGKNDNYKDSLTQSVSHAEPQKSLAGEGSGEFKQDGKFSVPSATVREHQKARAKKKYIEPRRNETSVIHSLSFSELPIVRRREKFYECLECGESFARSSDLIEHQKIHDREKPSGSRHYERSVICSFPPTDPQTSYAQEQYAEEQARNKSREFGQCSTTSSNLGAHQKICAQEKSHGEEPCGKKAYGQEPHGEKSHGQEPRGKKSRGQEPHDEEPQGKKIRGQEPHDEEPQGQMICGQEPHGKKAHGQEPHDEEPHSKKARGQEPEGEETQGQKIHDQEPHGEEPQGQKIHDQEPHGEEPQGQKIHDQESHGEEPQGQKIHDQEPRGEEPQGQKIHEQEPHGEEPQGQKIHDQEPHGEEPQGQKIHDQETHGEESQGQKIHDQEPHGEEPHSQKIHDQEPQGEESQGQKIHDQEPHGEEPQGQKIHDQEPHGKEPQDQKIHDQEPHGEEPQGQKIHDQEPHGEEPQGQKIHDQEPHGEEPQGQKIHEQEPHGEEPHSQKIHDQEPHGEEPNSKETHGEESHGQETVEDAAVQGSGSDEPQKDNTDDAIYECECCGLGFGDLIDLTAHHDVHSRKAIVDSHEYTQSVAHTYSISDYQQENTGEQLFECQKCGESFIHSSFLFEHQRLHEQDEMYSESGCDDGFSPLLPVKPRKNRAADTNPALAGWAIRCLQCGQGFIHSSALNEHMRHHRDDEILEQSEMDEGMFMQSLALAELQESETNEKLFECAICGECFFTAKELRDHHARIHKDEPYEYGPSYSHTSFLTEPLRQPIPYYECDDCGQTFFDDTVLTKSIVFHPEEVATVQEVNVLIPQEVLQVQGSNTEAAEPEMEAAEPELEAAEPDVEAAEPNGEAEGPDGEAAEPNEEAEQPNGEAEQPNGDADEPDGAGIEDPEERVEEPEGKAEEPEGDADEPDGAGIEDPEEEGEEQEIEIEEPYYNCQECTETFASSAAFGEHLKTHASVIIFEPANAFGECSGYIEHASTSAGGAEQADEKYFKCDVCGQLFSDRLSLARHQNTHIG